MNTGIIVIFLIRDSYQPPFGLSLSKPVLSLPKWPCADSDMPFDKALLSCVEGLRANGLSRAVEN
jgi:hypothetical protein